MKHLIFLLLLFPVLLFGQSYSGEVKVPGKNAAYLFTKAKEWFKENHKSPDNSPFTEDAANGKIKGNGQFSFIVYSNDVALNMVTYYVLVVTVKDNLYSYAFDNIMVEHGRKFPLSMFKNGMTKEGSIELYKSGGMTSPGKKAIETNVDYSIKVFNQCQSDIEGVIARLEDTMKS